MKKLFNILVALMLLPTTLYWGFALSVAALLYWQHVIPTLFLGFNASLLLSGFSLYSVWWLYRKYENITLSEIPGWIWAGTLSGIVISVLWLRALNVRIHTHNMPDAMAHVISYATIAGTPLIAGIMLVMLIRLNGKTN